MPYATLSELPANVQELSKNKQKRWRAIFNSVFAQTKSDERAFRSANAILKESKKQKEENDMGKNGYRDFDYACDLSEAVNGVETGEGVVKGVVILTGEKVSRNKTFYTKKALGEAVSRYEGAKMYLDHPKPDDGQVRSVRDLGGTYKNLRIEEGSKLRGDLHLLPNRNIRELVFPIVESAPAGVGLSIRDRGKGRDEDGVFLVEGFAPKASFSIDLVTEASVNESLMESIEGGNDDMDISKLTLDELQKGNPALMESIKSEERSAVLKEFEEKIKKGEEADKVILASRKIAILVEAAFPKEVSEKIKTLIEVETVSFDMAESIVKTHKELIEAIPAAGKPLVEGHGDSKDDDDKKKDELPSDDKIAEAVTNA